MREPRFKLRLALFVGATVVVAILLWKAPEKRRLARENADGIERELDALDPVTRAATVARLARDALGEVRDRAESS